MLYRTDLEIKGHVKNPGKKPFRYGMDVIDLIWLGGGFEDEMHLRNTYMDKGILLRWDMDKLRKSKIPFRVDSVLNGKSIANMELQMGMRLEYFPLMKFLVLKIMK